VFDISKKFAIASKKWKAVNPVLLPFSDVASKKNSLQKLIQLSFFQISVGIVFVLLVGTLNRVMIVELGVSSSLVAIMVAIPLVFAPFRALIGFRSDTHKSAIGWRRIPYLWIGSLLLFGGLATMPFALILLSGDTHWPRFFAVIATAFSFLLVGSGAQIVQTAGLALATDVVDEPLRPRVVALMYSMLLLGMIVSGAILSSLLEPFSQIKLIQVIQGVAVLTFVLNMLALWKQETRDPNKTKKSQNHPTFTMVWNEFTSDQKVRRFFLALAIGTIAFSMQDVILEPYGGEILNMSVGETTLLTTFSSSGAFLAFGVAAWILNKSINPNRLAAFGALVGIIGFSFIVFSEPTQLISLFLVGVFIIGFGGGLFSISCLTAAMHIQSGGFSGLVLGTWGAIQALSMGAGIALGGLLRDLTEFILTFSTVKHSVLSPNLAGYLGVYHLEIFLLFLVLVVIGPLVGKPRGFSTPNVKKFGLARFPN
tara:strand:+ start:912 stop:2357 length:1446 start_codon:yes stop_codon:yes gene_type:complete